MMLKELGCLCRDELCQSRLEAASFVFLDDVGFGGFVQGFICLGNKVFGLLPLARSGQFADIFSYLLVGLLFLHIAHSSPQGLAQSLFC